MARLISRRTTHTLLALLGLFLFGTLGFLYAVRAYFSIDQDAIIRSEELGTWDEIRLGAPEATLSWENRYPLLAKAVSIKPHETVKLDPAAQSEFDDAIAKHAAEAAKAAGFGDDKIGFIPSWRNNTPKAWDPVNDPPEKIPRIIHQTWKEAKLPPEWQVVRDECQRMHPDYEYMLWTDAESRKFLEEHYSWFLPTFDAYPYPIQRADAIRYFVLHKYGGIYMDLDVGCLRRFDPLLRFEIVLPKTIPVGVSNDVMAAAKGHPFMDHLIHNLVTFNHRYLTHYPTVMFSTGPMFVSASYGLYVDSHGLAAPSTPKNPSAGFKGIRVLPKSLYGKNAKPSEAPDAFFRHFYGSSWHAGDAGFLIFLRDRGRLLIFIGFCIIVFGFARSSIARFFASLNQRGEQSSRRRRSSRHRGRWITLPFVRDPRSGEYRSISQDLCNKPLSRRFLDEATQTQSIPSPTTATGAAEALGQELRVAAPKPQRATMPLLDYADSDNSNGDDDIDLGPGLNAERSDGLLQWANGAGGSSPSRPQSAASNVLSNGSDSASTSWIRGRSGSASKAKANASGSSGGILYLPAFLVGSGGNSSSSSASQEWSFANAQDDLRVSLDGQIPTTPGAGSAVPWKLTQPHTRSGSTSQNRSFSEWASSFVDAPGGAASQMSSGLSKMWNGVNWGARTPSPSALLGGTLNRLRMSSDGNEPHDVESPPMRPLDSAALQHIDAMRMSTSNSATSQSSLLARTASMNRAAAASTGNSGNPTHNGDVFVSVDDVPPPYSPTIEEREKMESTKEY